MIKTKSIFEPKSEDDGHRILITRYYPRGVKKEHFDEWARELSPNRELLQNYKEGIITWEQFRIEFLTQMQSDLEAVEILETLSHDAKNNDVTLLCYEKSGVPCHRHILHKLIIEQMNPAQKNIATNFSYIVNLISP